MLNIYVPSPRREEPGGAAAGAGGNARRHPGVCRRRPRAGDAGGAPGRAARHLHGAAGLGFQFCSARVPGGLKHHLAGLPVTFILWGCSQCKGAWTSVASKRESTMYPAMSGLAHSTRATGLACSADGYIFLSNSSCAGGPCTPAHSFWHLLPLPTLDTVGTGAAGGVRRGFVGSQYPLPSKVADRWHSRCRACCGGRTCGRRTPALTYSDGVQCSVSEC